MEISEFGRRYSQNAGILSLMKDLGEALASGGEESIMMGGGNPGFIPAFHEMMMQRLQDIASDSHLCRRATGIYSSPQGDNTFVERLALLLQKEQGWELGPENICLTNGSQAGFFLLFNMFAGTFADGKKKKIRLPLAPEYIGYADIGLAGDLFIASRPKVELLENGFFKYHVDFDTLDIGEETGAICVSRPTNPTGNVITDTELRRLDQCAKEAGVPLIIDNAYGLPFPGIVFSDAIPLWNSNIILCLSLSKLGLPATRTGIIVADKEIVRILSGMNAIMALAPTGFGALLVEDLVASADILRIGREMIQPFYKDKAFFAVECIQREFAGLPVRIHKPEGAIFLWLWFEGLPISSLELYQRLKKRGVLVISGHYFFPGLEHDDWAHKEQCIRITYSQENESVKKGIAIIGEEVRRAYAGHL
jgi:valine--pyruvate aminotransferase